MAKRERLTTTLSKRVVECLRFVNFTNRFRLEQRTIWFRGKVDAKGKRLPELDGEHAFQLAMFAWFIRDRHLRHLSREKILLYALVHDLPETYARDTPAFPDPDKLLAGQKTHVDKKERERRAIERLEIEWFGPFPAMIKYLHAYEKQEDEESRLVYALDKFLAELNIHADHGYTDKKLQVTRQAKEAYKKPRIAVHPLIAEFYEDLCRFCRIKEDVRFDPQKKTDAAV